MRTYFYHFFILSLVTSLLFSCKEKEIELEASPDILFSVRSNEVIVEVKDVPNKTEVEEAAKGILQGRVHFVRSNVYEMKQGTAKVIDLYENLNSFYDKKIKATGQYSFASEDILVTFDFGDSSNTYLIDGHFGNGFYNHFVRKDGTGSHHTVEASKVFCLHDDYLDELKEEYPDLVSAYIKTDLITIRGLETFK